MHVIIDDQHLAPAVAVLRVACGDGDIVEDAEAHPVAWARVVSGWADQRIGVARAALGDGVQRDQWRASGQRGGAPAPSRDVDLVRQLAGTLLTAHRVFIGLLLDGALDPANVVDIVDGRQI